MSAGDDCEPDAEHELAGTNRVSHANPEKKSLCEGEVKLKQCRICILLHTDSHQDPHTASHLLYLFQGHESAMRP